MAVRLAAVEYGAGENGARSPLAILHGLFGSGRNWATIAQRLGSDRRVVVLDLRNHGASPWQAGMTYGEMAADVGAALQARGIERFDLLGHSMGGKVAMAAALQHDEAVDRLVVVDIAPVAYQPRHLGHVEALRRLDLAGIRRRAEADARLRPAVADAAERAFLLQNLVFDGGTVRWRLNLAAIERAMPELVGFPEFPAGSVYRGPTLFVAGGSSDYLRPEHEPAIRQLFPNAEFAVIAEAGHLLHAEQPKAFLAVVEPFLDGSD